MRIVIAGAGAIGGCIGAHLARVGADVVLYARGPHLHAMQEHGLRIVSAEGEFLVKPNADRFDVPVPATRAVYGAAKLIGRNPPCGAAGAGSGSAALKGCTTVADAL